MRHRAGEVSRLSIRIAVADDHPVVLAGLEHFLSGLTDITVIGFATDSTALVELLGSNDCDVVVTDFSMPHGRYGDGIALLRFLQRRFPSVHAVVLTSVENSSVLRSILDIGVRAIVGKSEDPAYLAAAIRNAHANEGYLSPEVQRIVEAAGREEANAPLDTQLSKRETEVLRLFAEGLTVSEIGTRIGRSRKTVSAQKVTAMKKLGLERDADIFRFALLHGLIQASQVSRGAVKDVDDEG